jgi:hypothetical protein
MARISRLCILIAALLICLSSVAQVAGPNTNVIAGVGDQFVGDRFLQRQNEPTLAVSTRNPDHLVAAFNDYSTVDIAGDPSVAPSAEAWVGVAFSYDRGRSWSHTLIPGFPQDQSPAGKASPLFGLPAGSDPVITAGPNGRMYLGAIFFDRAGTSTVSVTRYQDRNNSESRHNFFFLGTSVVDRGSASPTGAFTDKPSIAADIPRPGAPCGNVYMAYSIFDGTQSNGNFRSKIMLARSLDCGATFQKPIKLNGNVNTNQGTQTAIDPNDGTVYVMWRTFFPDQMVFVKSSDLGSTFTPPAVVNTTGFATFEQDTFPDAGHPAFPPTFRSEAFPTMAVDALGRVYASWQERVNLATGLPDPNGVPRIVITTSSDKGASWSLRKALESAGANAHQLMPSLTFAQGILRLLFYDFRNNNLPLDPLTGQISGLNRLVDVRYAESNLSQFSGGNPQFNASVQVTQYTAGQSNPPNLPMYQGGTVPFFGDYITVSALAMVNQGNTWRFTTLPSDVAARNSSTVWTDNRDVIIPQPPSTFTQYSPPGTGSPSCINPGSRNANVYSAEVSPGLIAGSPMNFKSLTGANNQPLQRSFPVYVQNTTAVSRFVRLMIVSSDPAVIGSFLQFSVATTMDREILPGSSITQTVFASSNSLPTGALNVSVQEITAINGSVVSSGLAGNIPLNSDPTTAVTNVTTETHTPQVTNPQVTNPQVTNSTITDVAWTVTNIGNTTSAFTSVIDVNNAQQLQNNGFNFKVFLRKRYLVPTFSGCQTIEVDQPVSTSNIANPQVTNPQVTNPQVTNPQVTNPQVTNASFYLAPSDVSVSAFAQSSPIGADGTTLAPRAPDALVLVLRVTQTKSGGPKFDPSKIKVTHAVWAEAANTGKTTPDSTVSATTN